MKKLKFILIGAGNRGNRYAHLACKQGCELVGMADPNPVRRKYFQDTYGVPAAMCFSSYEELFAQGKIADFAMITTQDRFHYEPAMQAMEQGYDLLLEKPVAPTAKECADICRVAEEKKIRIVVCHVLRYTPFFRLVKSIIQSGKLGKIMSIVHTEGVGDIHYSHSYVRGPWCNSGESSDMLLAKSCHDIDIIQWLLDSKCTKVQSFGSLSYFTKENCPEDAAYRCIDCPLAESCRYNAQKIYQNPDNCWHLLEGFQRTEDAVDKALKESSYGVCVFQSNNNVVDHQTVNLEFEHGETVAFTMSAFNTGGRRIRIMGTKGELWSEDLDNIELVTFMETDKSSAFYGQLHREHIKATEHGIIQGIEGGHAGGDAGIIEDLCLYFGADEETASLSSIRTSVLNHLTVFAAEESRRTNTVVDVDTFIANNCGEF